LAKSPYFEFDDDCNWPTKKKEHVRLKTTRMIDGSLRCFDQSELRSAGGPSKGKLSEEEQKGGGHVYVNSLPRRGASLKHLINEAKTLSLFM
jgi:hypothetical protein